MDDESYDANALRRRLHADGGEAAIPGRSDRKMRIDNDKVRYMAVLRPQCRH